MSTPKPIEDIIKKFSTQTLQDIVIEELIIGGAPQPGAAREKKPTDLSKTEIRAHVSKRSEEYGVKALLRLMSQVDLEVLYEAFKKPTAKKTPEDEKKKSKVVLSKRLKEEILKITLNKWASNLTAEQVVIVGAYVTTSKKEMNIGLPSELREAGFRMFLEETPVDILQKMVDEHNIPVESRIPSVLIKAIMTGKKPTDKKKKKVVEIEYSKKKPVLKAGKGITYHDIFQHFYLEELQEYLREKELKVSGTKPQLIRRILKFWEDPTTGKPKQRVAKPKTAVPDKKKAEVESDSSEDESESEDEVAEAETDSEDETETTKEKTVFSMVPVETKSPSNLTVELERASSTLTAPIKKNNKKAAPKEKTTTTSTKTKA